MVKKKQLDKTMHLFCCNEDNPDKMEKSLNLFKAVFPDEKFITITDNHHLNFMLKNMRDRSKYLHYTTKEISYYMYAIAKLSTALLEVIIKKPCWKETIEACILTNLLQLPIGFKLNEVDLEKPEQLIRLVSGFFIKAVDCTRNLFSKDSKTFSTFCNDMITVCCRLTEKYIGPMLIKAFEDGLTKAILEKKPKKYIQEIEDEIKALKISAKSVTQSLTEIANIFNSNIRILLIYIYAMYVINTMKVHGSKEPFLVAISSVDYSVFIGLLYDEFGKNNEKMNVNVFGDTAQKELDEQLEFVNKVNLQMKEDEAEKIRLSLIEEEEREKQKKLELEKLEAEKIEKAKLKKEKLEKEKLEKERLKLEAERLEKQRLESERLEKERLKMEAERLRIEKERLESERLEKERLEAERLKMEAERLEKERLEKERLRIEKERLEKERLREKERLESERLESEKLESERLEAEKLKISSNKKLNPYVKEFNPAKNLNIKIENNGIYIDQGKSDQMLKELNLFKNNPHFYISNKSCFLFEMMENHPEIFKYNEIRGLIIAKNIELLLNSIVKCLNITVRDNLYTQLKLTETMFFKIINE